MRYVIVGLLGRDGGVQGGFPMFFLVFGVGSGDVNLSVLREHREECEIRGVLNLTV